MGISIAQYKAIVKRQEFSKTIGQREFDYKETMKVLKHNFMVYGSWGVSKVESHLNKALMLQVKGMHHQGKVWITLAWDDTYTVHIATNQNTVIKTYEMVYFDMLVNIIDGYIEKRK